MKQHTNLLIITEDNIPPELDGTINGGLYHHTNETGLNLLHAGEILFPNWRVDSFKETTIEVEYEVEDDDDDYITEFIDVKALMIPTFAIKNMLLLRNVDILNNIHKLILPVIEDVNGPLIDVSNYTINVTKERFLPWYIPDDSVRNDVLNTLGKNYIERMRDGYRTKERC